MPFLYSKPRFLVVVVLVEVLLRNNQFQPVVLAAVVVLVVEVVLRNNQFQPVVLVVVLVAAVVVAAGLIHNQFQLVFDSGFVVDDWTLPSEFVK